MRGYSYIIISSLVLLSGCNYRMTKDGEGVGFDKQTDSVASDEIIGWDLMRTSVLSSCFACHSGKRSPNLSTLSRMKNHIGSVWSEVNGETMPPRSSGLGPLSACEKAIVKKWRALGTPETSTVTVGSLPECPQAAAPDIPLADMPLNYQTLKDRILKPQCITCHNSADLTDAGLILFTTYAELMADERYWRTPAATSKVVRLVRSTDLGVRMPPPEGVALTEEQINFIERWIDAGKPEL